jgi:hypothetical protein
MIGNIVAGLYDAGAGPAVGDFKSIATVTVGVGGATPIDFTSISSDYQHLQIRGMIRGNSVNTGADSMLIRFNTDSSSVYAIHRLWGTGSGVNADGYANITDVSIGSLLRSGNTSNVYAGFVIDILDYKNTNKFKTMRALSGWDGNGSGEIWFQSGLWRSTSAINAIRFLPGGSSTLFNAGSTFALYGIKG